MQIIWNSMLSLIPVVNELSLLQKYVDCLIVLSVPNKV